MSDAAPTAVIYAWRMIYQSLVQPIAPSGTGTTITVTMAATEVNPRHVRRGGGKDAAPGAGEGVDLEDRAGRLGAGTRAVSVDSRHLGGERVVRRPTHGAQCR